MPKRNTTRRPCREPAATLGDVFVSTNSLTKAYGLAGLRCGWIMASPSVSARVREIRDVIDGSGPYVAERLSLTAFEQIDRLKSRARQILAENLSIVRAMAQATSAARMARAGRRHHRLPARHERRQHERSGRAADSRSRHHRRARSFLPGAATHPDRVWRPERDDPRGHDSPRSRAPRLTHLQAPVRRRAGRTPFAPPVARYAWANRGRP